MPDSWQIAMPDTALAGGIVLIHARQQFLSPDGVQLVWPRDALPQLQPWLLDVQGIGYWQGERVYLYELTEAASGLPGQWLSLRHFLQLGCGRFYRMLSYASQVGVWSREHRFCGSCGQPMQRSQVHRMRFCSACALEVYPRISPCMIVLVSDGERLLLSRAPRFAPGMYSCQAGFSEPGETIEECVHRELAEEVNVRVRNLRYVTSQSWPYPHSLMLGFFADYAGGELVLQEDEVEDAAWFTPDALPGLPMQGSIARYLIDRFLSCRSGSAEPVLPG